MGKVEVLHAGDGRLHLEGRSRRSGPQLSAHGKEGWRAFGVGGQGTKGGELGLTEPPLGWEPAYLGELALGPSALDCVYFPESLG